MSVTVTVTKKQGNTMGTVIARVGDQQNVVRDVYFYVRVLDNGSSELGPYPPDIVRRPLPGVYEKDVVLDPTFETIVRTVVFKDDGTEVTGIAEQSFGIRTAAAGGTGEVRVKDANTGPTPAETLAIEGATVTVSNRVATFNLGGALASYYTKAESDGRYPLAAHTHPYLPLAGGVMSERLEVEKNTVDPNFRTGHLELRTTNGSAVAVGFHRSLFSAVTLRHGVLGALDLVDHNGAWAQYRGSSFWAAGNRFHGGDGAFIDLTNGAAQFLTSGGSSLQGRFGGLLVSDSYGDAPSVPSLGIYSKGGARLGPYIDVGVGASSSTIRRPDGAALYLQAGVPGAVNIGDPASLYKLNVQGDVYAQGGWLRTNGIHGWYNQTHGGGINMEDATWVRVYNGKSFLVPGNFKTYGAIYGSGAAVRLSSDDSYWYATTASGMQFYGMDGGRKGFVYHDPSGFGLLHGGGAWAVRTWPGGTMLYGSSLTDEGGNQLAAIKTVTAAPDAGTAARVGTLYVLVA
ncbi:MAG TPA: shufflon system plasmid conjugative transfer pilus tip adhesin PilV [Longimicrobium sp.]|jgi:hypothetical protein